MMDEKRILQLDLFKLSVKDLIGLLQNKALDAEERQQILVELQKRNAGTRCKQFLEIARIFKKRSGEISTTNRR